MSMFILRIIAIIFLSGRHSAWCNWNDLSSSKEENIWQEKESVQLFLRNFDKQFLSWRQKCAIVEWNYTVNMTTENERKKVAVNNAREEWIRKKILISRKFNPLLLSGLNILPLAERRQLKLLRSMMVYNDPEVSKEILRTELGIKKMYATAQICLSNGKCIGRGEDIMTVYEQSDDYDFLKELWAVWRNQTGRRMKTAFTKLIRLKNVVARQNGYDDMGNYERVTELEDPTFDKGVIHLYSKIEPLYRQIHAYVRHKLKSKYPGRISETEPLPAHVVRNMWSQTWSNIYEDVKPFKSVKSDNLTTLVQKNNNWTLHRMAKESEKFYTSLGFERMTPDFWKNSILKKPKNQEMECHGTAYNFFNKKAYRISMCGHLIAADLFTIHHEMGHVVYYMSYRNQPSIFQESANVGFHEAIGDTIYLSVQTTKHLHKLGLAAAMSDSYKTRINQLMLTALSKVVFYPFALAMDSWMWGVHNGSITPDNYNSAWWKLRVNLQGLKPPVSRSEMDFDPGAKFHIAAGVSYIRYFISYILQFQFYDAMCEASNHEGPLDQCDFYHSKSAGHKLKNMLNLGTSRHWRYALKQMTGQEEYDPTSVLKYFKPLHEWLLAYNKKNNVIVGW